MVTLGKNKPYIGDEKQFQAATATVLKYRPELYGVHVANERGGKTHVAIIQSLKRQGLTAGVFDWLIFTPSREYNGLAIELKVRRPLTKKERDKGLNLGRLGTLSPEQEEFAANLERCGWLTAAVYNLDSFNDLLDWYTGKKLRQVSLPRLEFNHP